MTTARATKSWKWDFKNSWNFLVDGYTYYCNSLPNFEYEANIMTGNGDQVYLTKLDRTSGSTTTQEVTTFRAMKRWKYFPLLRNKLEISFFFWSWVLERSLERKSWQSALSKNLVDFAIFLILSYQCDMISQRIFSIISQKLSIIKNFLYFAQNQDILANFSLSSQRTLYTYSL